MTVGGAELADLGGGEDADLGGGERAECIDGGGREAGDLGGGEVAGSVPLSRLAMLVALRVLTWVVVRLASAVALRPRDRGRAQAVDVGGVRPWTWVALRLPIWVEVRV